jgi:SAM-dependent methyltransferase
VTDLGCGLGRVVFAASWLGARRAVGVELIPWLAQAAERNRRASRLAARDIRIVEGDAGGHSLGDTTLLYMFHAFGEGVLSQVVDGAGADRERAAQAARAPLPPLRVAYVNPVHEAVLARCGWLRRVAELPPAKQWFSNADHYATAIWESTS